jgi:hypothetical protein
MTTPLPVTGILLYPQLTGSLLRTHKIYRSQMSTEMSPIFVSMEVTRSRLPTTGIGVIGNFIDEVRIRINRIKYMYGGGFTGNSSPYQILRVPVVAHTHRGSFRLSSSSVSPSLILDTVSNYTQEEPMNCSNLSEDVRKRKKTPF